MNDKYRCKGKTSVPPSALLFKIIREYVPISRHGAKPQAPISPLVLYLSLALSLPLTPIAFPRRVPTVIGPPDLSILLASMSCSDLERCRS